MWKWKLSHTISTAAFPAPLGPSLFIQLSLCRQRHLAKTLPQYTHCCNSTDRITPVNSLSIGLAWIVSFANNLVTLDIPNRYFENNCIFHTVNKAYLLCINILQFFAVKLKWLNQFDKLRHTTCEGKLKWGWVGIVE